MIARYAVPVFEIEGDDGFATQTVAWAEVLHERPWVTTASVNGTVTRVVKDRQVGTAWAWVRPAVHLGRLEDVFCLPPASSEPDPALGKPQG